ncbi:MAG: glucosyltransferase domain-containing protein [Eubacteriales bacterium]
MYFTYKSFKKFCKENIPLLILIPIITFLAYGGKIFYQTISFDLEFLMDDPDAFYSSWITLHRWALIPYKFLSGTWTFNMPMEITYTIVNLMLAMFLFGWLLDVLTDGRNRLGVAVFLALFLTHPVWGEQYVYMLQGAAISFYTALTAVALMLFADGVAHKSLLRFILGFAAAVFCFGAYQSFDSLIVAGLCAVYILVMRKEQMDARAGWLLVLKSAVFIVGAFIISQLIGTVWAKVTGVVGSQYFANMTSWGRLPVGECLLKIRRAIGKIFFAKDFYYNLLYPVCTFLGLALFWFRRKEYKCVVLPVLAYCLLILAPFYLIFLTGQSQQSRSHFAGPFAFAFLAFFVLLEFSRQALYIAGAVLAFAVSISQIVLIERIHYTEYIRYEQDLARATDISRRINMITGSEYNELPLVFVGNCANNMNRTCVPKHDDAYVGTSLFEVEQIAPNKLNSFMSQHGMHYGYATGDVIKRGYEISAELGMPTYPADGSIAVYENIIIVRLS